MPSLAASARCSVVACGLLLGAACTPPPAPVDDLNLYRIPYAAFPLPVDNQPSAARLELGRLLFFDPLLSANRRIACATCHQPTLAMGDGRGLGVALADAAGGDLPRGSPSLYNARFQHRQFWDGRAVSLEDLALQPIQNRREMGNTLPELLRSLDAVPEYRQRFADAYGGLDASSVARAIAAFVASLTANDTPADRYLAGDQTALSDEAAAGFGLYYGKARCSRCHYLPLFAGTEGVAFDTTEFRVTGVPELGVTPPILGLDRGRAGVVGVDVEPSTLHAFKAPTLRNIAHSAPYMHNGVFTTLEQVVDFYDRGAGPGLGYAVPNVDRVFATGAIGLSDDEKRALVRFLREGLSDLSQTPASPLSVPSGLAVGGYPPQ